MQNLSIYFLVFYLINAGRSLPKLSAVVSGLGNSSSVTMTGAFLAGTLTGTISSWIHYSGYYLTFN